MRLLAGHTKAVRSVAYFPDGRLVSGGDDRTVRVWDAAGGCVAVWQARGAVCAVTCHPTGGSVAFADRPHRSGRAGVVITMWNPATGQAAEWSDWPADPARPLPVVWSVGVSADGRYLAAARGVLVLGRPQSDGAEGRWWRLDGSAAGDFGLDTCVVAFAPVGAAVAVWDRDDVTLFDQPGGAELYRHRLESWGGRPMAFCPAGRRLYALVGGTVVGLDVSDPDSRRYLHHRRADFRAVAATPDGRTVLVGAKPGRVDAVPTAGGRPTADWDFGVGTVHGLAVAPDGCTFAVAGAAGLAVCDLG